MSHFRKTIRLLPSSSKGAVSTDGVMFLQRQGVGNMFYLGLGGDKGFFLERGVFLESGASCPHRLYYGRYCELGEKSFTLGCLDDAIRLIEPLKCLGDVLPSRFSKADMGYMYHGPTSYNNVDKDVILSPLVFEASTDTIRHAVTNICVVAFRNQQFNDRDLDVDVAAKPYRTYIEKALSSGFHDCDRKQGDAYCKRRLAWLAGEYMRAADAEKGTPTDVGVLNNAMEWHSQYIDI